MKPLALLALAICLLNPDAAQAASFPCEKASTAVEKLICADAEVSTLDEHLGRYYSAARAAVGSASSCLGKNQRDWLRKMRNPCKDAACLKRVYLARLSELDALQPGMTAIEDIELPIVKALVWIVPAADDTEAGPPPAKPVPLVHTGKLLEQFEGGGDGYVLVNDAGVKQSLVQLMFITKSTGVALETLSRNVDDRYEARGVVEQAPGGTPHFAPTACVFLYRLPASPPK